MVGIRIILVVKRILNSVTGQRVTRVPSYSSFNAVFSPSFPTPFSFSILTPLLYPPPA